LGFLNNLGAALLLRAKLNLPVPEWEHDFPESMDDLNAAVDATQEAVKSSSNEGHASQVNNLITLALIKRASQLLTTAIELLPTTSPRTLQQGEAIHTFQVFWISRRCSCPLHSGRRNRELISDF